MSIYDPLSTSLMWRAAAITALIDAPLLALLARRISSEHFRALKWYLVGSAALAFALIWGLVGSIVFWDEVYSAIFPAWFHWLLPLIYGPLFGAWALLFWHLSCLAAKGRVVWFILLGGLVSLVGHTVGIFLGLFKVPLLADTSITASLVFGIFEFIFYFCIIVALARAARWLTARLKRNPSPSLAKA